MAPACVENKRLRGAADLDLPYGFTATAAYGDGMDALTSAHIALERRFLIRSTRWVGCVHGHGQQLILRTRYFGLNDPDGAVSREARDGACYCNKASVAMRGAGEWRDHGRDGRTYRAAPCVAVTGERSPKELPDL
jgi:hypothetical protein